MSRFVFLSGPSCVGKGPLLKTVQRFSPNTYDKLKRVVLSTSRPPRPGEVDGVDYNFRTVSEIKALDPRTHVIFPVRKMWQAVNLQEVKDIAEGRNQIGFLEIFHEGALQLRRSHFLKGIEMATVFLSPLSRQEIIDGIRQVGFQQFRHNLATLMWKKNYMRFIAWGEKDLGKFGCDAFQRANSAFEEMRSAHAFHFVIPNHDGEDSQNWEQEPPIGDASKTYHTFLRILRGQTLPPGSDEKWPKDLLDPARYQK